jgi:hypothetical protein
MGMEMSLFAACPLPHALAGPNTSGRQPRCRIIVKSALRVRPDVSGHAEAPYYRAWDKKRHLHAHTGTGLNKGAYLALRNGRS